MQVWSPFFVDTPILLTRTWAQSRVRAPRSTSDQTEIGST